MCPVDAISYEDDVPETDLPVADAAKAMFADYGSPGGAAQGGPVPDPALVLALPPQQHPEI